MVIPTGSLVEDVNGGDEVEDSMRVMASGFGIDSRLAMNPYSASSYVVKDGNFRPEMAMDTEHSM